MNKTKATDSSTNPHTNKEKREKKKKHIKMSVQAARINEKDQEPNTVLHISSNEGRECGF